MRFVFSEEKEDKKMKNLRKSRLLFRTLCDISSLLCHPYIPHSNLKNVYIYLSPLICIFIQFLYALHLDVIRSQIELKLKMKTENFLMHGYNA